MTTWTRHLYEHDPLAIAKGESNGYSVVNMFGYQPNVSTTFIPAWEYATAYTYPTTAINLTVDSANSDDDGSTIRVVGLDSNYDVIVEDVLIDTASPNTTTNQFLRVNDLFFFDTDGNEGVITASNGGTVYAAIRAGDGKSQAAIYTVPRNHSLYLWRIQAFSADSTSSKPAMFRNFTRTPEGRFFTVGRTTFAGDMNILRNVPFKYEERTDVQFQVSTAQGTHEVSAFGEGVLVKNTIQGEP
jgi:hypothetical protein